MPSYMVLESLSLKPVIEFINRRTALVGKSASLTEILEELRRRGVDRALVIDNKRLKGIITMRDLISKLATASTRLVAPSTLHASGFMTEPVYYVTSNDMLQKAVTLMVNGGFTSVPVVDSEGRVIGVITRNELAQAIGKSEDAKGIGVSSVMRPLSATVRASSRILYVRQLILNYNISVLPVVENGRLMGAVGVDEIASAIINYYRLARGEPKRITPLKYLRAIDIAKIKIPRVDHTATLADAARIMAESGYRAVFIVKGEDPVGVITGLELAEALIK